MGQFEQTAGVASFWPWYIPALHIVHTLLFVVKKLPDTQNLHKTPGASLCSWYFPSAQPIHAVLVVSNDVEAEQNLQEYSRDKLCS